MQSNLITLYGPDMRMDQTRGFYILPCIGKQVHLHVLRVMQGVVSLRDAFAILPEYSSLEWTYPNTGQK